MNEWLVLTPAIAILLVIAFHSIARKVAWNWWYYNFYMRSIHWRVKRWMKKTQRRVLNRWIVSCEKCGSKNRIIIHHVTYKRLWRERLSDLQVLCWSCHRPGSGRI
jgi:hypothetical protein